MEDRIHRAFPKLSVIVHPNTDERIQELGYTDNALVGEPNYVQFFHFIGNPFLRAGANCTIKTEE
jgi:hypothetical protein